MAQKNGERAPDRVTSKGLRSWLELKPILTELDMVLIGQDCTHSVAALHGFSDDPRREAAKRHNRITMAIADANARAMVEAGEGISTTTEYLHWKIPGAPAMQTIYNVFGTWERAKYYAGIGKTPQPGPSMLRTKGERNRKGAGVQWSLDDRVRAVATFREHGCPGAYRLGTEEFVDWREQWPQVLPAYKTVIGQVVTVIDGKKRLRLELTWQEMNRLAEELALREPKTYPSLAARARLMAA